MRRGTKKILKAGIHVLTKINSTSDTRVTWYQSLGLGYESSADKDPGNNVIKIQSNLEN